MTETARSCEETWKHALENCRRMLDPEDFKLVTEFESAEKLLQEVQRLEHQYSRSLTLRLLKGIKSHLTHLQTFSTVLLVGIGSGTISAAIVWGTSSLLIELSSRSEQALEEISEFLKALGNKFTLFELYKSAVEFDNDLLEEFFNLLVDLVLSSVAAIKHFRKNDIANAIKIATWSNVENKFKKTIKDLDSKVDHLRKLAKARHLIQLNRSQAHLAQRLEAMSTSGESTRPNGRIPTISVPFQKNSSFFGRSEIMKRIREYLQPTPGERVIRSAALWGTAGIGKTQVALEFATNQFNHGIPVVIWIASETAEEMINSFVKAANSLQPTGFLGSMPPDQKRQLILDWLQTTVTPWLLVFDNVEDDDALLQNWPVVGDGAIIVTCRSELKAVSPAAHTIEIPKFDAEEGTELLLKLSNKTTVENGEINAAYELVERIGGLAIAIELLGKQLFVRKFNINEFLEKFNVNRKAFLKRPRYGAKNPYYSLDVSTIWMTAFTSMSDNSAKLLGLLCLAAPDDIPQDMLKSDRQTDNNWNFLGDSDEFEDAKMELLDLSLIRINNQTGFIAIHRLTQDEFREYTKKEDRIRAFQVMADLLYHSFPHRKDARTHHLYYHWKSCEQLIQHVIAFQEAYEKLRGTDNRVQNSLIAELMADAGWYLAEIGLVQRASEMIQLAITSHDDKSDLTYATLCYTAGSLNHRWGRYEISLSNYQQALKIRETKCPEESNQLLTAYSAVGMALTGLYRGGEALPYFKSVFKVIDTKSEHAQKTEYNIDRYLRNRARAYLDVGRFGDAKSDLLQAEAWETKLFGDGSHYHGESQLQLGKIALKQGFLDQATNHFENSYEFFRKGKPTHPCVMAALYSLGKVNLAKGKLKDRKKNYDAALEYFKKALVICELNEPTRGDAGESARVQWQIARILDSQGEGKEAEVYRAKAENTKSKLRGTEFYPRYDDYADEEKSWDCFLNYLYR